MRAYSLQMGLGACLSFEKSFQDLEQICKFHLYLCTKTFYLYSTRLSLGTSWLVSHLLSVKRQGTLLHFTYRVQSGRSMKNLSNNIQQGRDGLDSYSGLLSLNQCYLLPQSRDLKMKTESENFCITIFLSVASQKGH